MKHPITLEPDTRCEALLKAEKWAKLKHPKDGKCPNSCFANGNHRVGLLQNMKETEYSHRTNQLLPTLAIFDEMCLECGKIFDKGFIARKSDLDTENNEDREVGKDK